MRCVFLFKQKTAYEMRISDWSSDVCSSDLAYTVSGEGYRPEGTVRRSGGGIATLSENADLHAVVSAMARCNDAAVRSDGDAWTVVGAPTEGKIGRASCRERVCQYV